MNERMIQFKESMRTRTMMWAGIAAAAGFGVGLAGRILRHRHKAIPHIVIIEGAG